MPAKKRKKGTPNPNIWRAERQRREAKYEDSGFWNSRTMGNKIRGTGVSDSRYGRKTKRK